MLGPWLTHEELEKVQHQALESNLQDQRDALLIDLMKDEELPVNIIQHPTENKSAYEITWSPN